MLIKIGQATTIQVLLYSAETFNMINKLMNRLSIRNLLKMVLSLTIMLSVVMVVGNKFLYHAIDKAREEQILAKDKFLLSKEIMLSVIQVQQYLTDVGATRQPDAFEIAEKHFKLANENISKLLNLAAEDEDAISKITQDIKTAYEIGLKMANSYITDGTEAGNSLMVILDDKTEQLSTNLMPLIDKYNSEFINTNSKQSDIQEKAEIKSILMAILFGIVIAIGMLLIYKKVMPPLRKIRASLDEINSGSGDLTARLIHNSKDVIGEITAKFNVFVENLQNMIIEIKTNADNIFNYSNQLTDISAQTLEGANKQNKLLDDIVSSANNSLTSVNSIKENATNASENTSLAKSEVSKGRIVVEESIKRMEELNNQTNHTSNIVAELQKQSESINGFLGVIRGIAEQTNLLALNAAIEAARAGEQGRGFAVVADEVRSLATKAHTSTEEIDKIITDMSQQVNQAVNSMEENASQVQSEVENSKKVGELLESIYNINDKVNDINTSITESISNQAVMMEIITKHTEDIQSISQENMQKAKESNQSIESQLLSISKLNELVSKFKI